MTGDKERVGVSGTDWFVFAPQPARSNLPRSTPRGRGMHQCGLFGRKSGQRCHMGFATPIRHIKQYTPRGFVGWQLERGERQEPTTLKITWSTRTERGRHARGGSGDRSDKDSDLSRHDVLIFGPAKNYRFV